jgi:hypothetical protein
MEHEHAPDYIVTIPGLDDAFLEVLPSREHDLVTFPCQVDATYLYAEAIVLRCQLRLIPGPLNLAIPIDDARALHTALEHLLAVHDSTAEEQ